MYYIFHLVHHCAHPQIRTYHSKSGTYIPLLSAVIHIRTLPSWNNPCLCNASANCLSDWRKVNQGVPQGSILGPLFFLLYVNDLPGIIRDISKPTIFADDTSFIFTHSNYINFKNEIDIVMEQISKWFEFNSLILNFNKMHYMQFTTKQPCSGFTNYL